MMKQTVLQSTLFILLSCCLSCSHQISEHEPFSLYEGTEYVISLFSSESLDNISVSHWGNITSFDISPESYSNTIPSILGIIKNSTPVKIEKKLTAHEYEIQNGIPVVEVAPLGAISFIRNFEGAIKTVNVSYYNTYGVYPRVVISDDYIVVTYSYKDAEKIVTEMSEILHKAIRR